MTIRPYQETDLQAVAALFTASIHALAVDAYTATQRAAWAPQPPDLVGWRAKLADLETLIAEQDGALKGFISFDRNGHIDLLYTAPTAARRGIASALYREVENQLVSAGVTLLHTEASLVAEPFFVHHGFRMIEKQRVIRRGVEFLRYEMSKVVGAAQEGIRSTKFLATSLRQDRS